MAITDLTTASSVNTLLHWILRRPGADGTIPAEEVAFIAAARLADSAHAKLMAGVRRHDVVAHWPWSDPGDESEPGTEPAAADHE
jgi:hypothetical protein